MNGKCAARSRRRILDVLTVLCALALVPLLVVAAAEENEEKKGFDHSKWADFLKEHVEDGWVDYAAIKKDTSQLRAYLADLAKADLKKLGRNEQIALYVNAYNAFTVKLITEYYPRIKSIKDIPDGIFSRKRWKHKRWAIGRRTYSLSEIEHDVLRSKFKDPRVHYALNCASISCPPLRGEPYEGEKLGEQLDGAAKAFQINPQGLRLARAQRIVYLSRIHDWYREDFEEAAGSVLRYVAQYAPRETAEFLLANEKNREIRYMDYDWRLNDVKNGPHDEQEDPERKS